jgi:hypothetical protein
VASDFFGYLDNHLKGTSGSQKSSDLVQLANPINEPQNKRRCLMELYACLDLHLRNTYIGILDKEFTGVFKKRVANNLEILLATLRPFCDKLKGIVVESTFNWYWLVDELMDAGYRCIHLANPSAIKQHEGLTHSDDQHEAFFLAQLLILGIWKGRRI